MIKPALRYSGGKSKALQQIDSILPTEHFPLYVEPMIGGGSVFFHAKHKGIADKYWINDLYEPLFNFWSAMQNPHNSTKIIKLLNKFIEQINGNIAWDKRSAEDKAKAKELYQSIVQSNPQSLDGKAVKYFVINRCSFSGTTDSGGFSGDRFLQSSVDRLKPISAFLQDVKITNLSVLDLIPQIPEGSFVFLDPPYISPNTPLYGKRGSHHTDFSHVDLAKSLVEYSTKFKFLMTYDQAILDHPEIKNLYKNYTIKNWSLQYGMNSWSSKKAKIGNEVFIYNY